MSNRQASNRRSSSSRAAVTPLPIQRISILGLILAANNTSIWMIFAFLPFMVEFFYPTLSKKELGFKAGLLGSAFSAGSLCGNFMWGVISDKIGRRPALLYGLIGTTVSAVGFGFAPSYEIAILMRFLWGFLNGNIAVAKTYMGEILDDSNTSKGMAIFGVIGGVGRTVGPVIGGFLAMPANHYHVFRGTVFEEYPFSLPSLVIAANCICILILSYFYLSETLIIRKTKKSKKDSGFSNPRETNVSGTTNGHSAYISVESNDESDDMIGDNREESNIKSNPFWLQGSPDKNSSKPGKRRKLLSVLDSSTQYGLLSNGEDEETGSNSVQAINPLHENTSESLIPNIPSPSSSSSYSSRSTPSKRLSDDERKQRHVSFAGLVMVKVIGSDLLAYGNLKKIDPVEEPLLTPSSPSSNNELRSSIDMARRNSDVSDDSYGVDDEEEFENLLSFRNSNNFASSAVLPQNIPRYSNGSSEFDTSSAASTSFISTIQYLFTRKEVVITTVLYGVIAFIQVATNEIFPLWVVTGVEDGGFGYDAHVIGLVTMITGPIAIFSQLVVYPYMAEQYGSLKVQKYGLYLYGTTLILMPLISAIRNAFPEAWLSFFLVTVSLSLLSIGAMWILVTVFILINNSCYSHQRGTVNGIGQTFASFGRLTGPYFAATLFAWSETNGLSWPLNYCFTFYLLGILSIVLTRVSLFLPKSIQRRKREPKEPRYALGMFDDNDEDSYYVEREKGLELRTVDDHNLETSFDTSTRDGRTSSNRFENSLSQSSLVDSEKKDEDPVVSLPSKFTKPISQPISNG